MELAALHGVSRRTIRTVLATLALQGLVESHRGSGWFVQPSQPQGFDRMRSFTQWARVAGAHRAVSSWHARRGGHGAGGAVCWRFGRMPTS